MTKRINDGFDNAKIYLQGQLNPNIKKDKKLSFGLMQGAQLITIGAVAFAAFQLLSTSFLPIAVVFAGYNTIRILENAKEVFKHPNDFQKAKKWNAEKLNTELKKNTIYVTPIIEFATARFCEKK
jgi:hypothetical protein